MRTCANEKKPGKFRRAISDKTVQIFYFDVREDPPRAAPFDAVPELFDAELFVPELLEAAPPFFAAVVFPAAPPADFADDLDDAPLLAEVFAVPVFVEDLPFADFAELDDPDLALPDFAEEDLAEPDLAAPVFAAPDFAAVDLDPDVFDVPDFAVDDFAVELLADPELFAPPLAPPADEREDELRDVLDFPVTVSAAAPIAPTAAPSAAPLRISPATPITASITFSVVDFPRLPVLLPEVFEREDAVRFELFCFVVFLSGMIFSLNRIEQMFVLKLSH
jgi:hypothetical protein